MSRDYARNRLSTPKQKSSRASSGFAWLLIGILIGFMIGGIVYLKTQKNSPYFSATSATSDKSEKINPVQPAKNTQPNVAKPADQTDHKNNPKNIEKLQTQFDFYNVLPNQKAIGPTGDEDLSHIDAQKQDNNHNTLPPEQPSDTNLDKNSALEPATEVDTDTGPETDVDNIQPKNINPEKQPAQKPKNEDKSPDKTKDNTQKQTQKNTTKQYILQIATLSKTEDTERLKAKLTLLGFDVQTAPVYRQGKTMTRLFLGPFDNIHEADAMHQQLQENMITSTRLKFNH